MLIEPFTHAAQVILLKYVHVPEISLDSGSVCQPVLGDCCPANLGKPPPPAGLITCAHTLHVWRWNVYAALTANHDLPVRST